MSGDVIAWGAAPLTVTIALDDDDRPRLVGFGRAAAALLPVERALPPVELELRGAAKGRGSRHVEQAASARLRYAGHDASDDRLELRLTDPETGLQVTQTWQRSGDAPVLRCHAEVSNDGTAPVTLRYVSSLVVGGFGAGDGPHWTSRLRLSYASMDTCAEFQWRTVSPADLGLLDVGIAGSTRRRIAFTGLGSTPSGEFLPAGAITDTVTGTAVVWQIEHNGAWHWEAGDHLSSGYLAVSGPTDQEHEWRQVLRPGDTFHSVPVAVTASADGLPAALSALTPHRRAIRRPHPDNDALPVVFNDYLNCLWGDPAEEKLLPIIDAAAKAGCEVFCVDAGWYSDEQSWWSSVGEWLPSASRFPSGLPSVLDRIAALGMVPGLWLEPEVVGVDSPVADQLPLEAFFQRDGERVNERGRYQLDLRHPAARAHLDATVDRLVALGVGYLKFDYNINIGAGTDVSADGAGAGLLGHNRAYLRWVEDLLDRHPGLTIESCAGGGARTDYATLSLHSIQSTSDQADHLRTVPIAAAAATAIAPEQAGVWVSPRPELSIAETELCVVNGLLGRMHVSGRPDLLSDEQFAAVASGLAVYKMLRGLVREGLPLWPTGLPGWTDDWVSYGLRAGPTTLLSVWRRGGGSDSVELPLPHLRGAAVTVTCAYPEAVPVEHRWDREAGVLTVTLPHPQAARLLRLVHSRPVTI
ncbi:glycoside hydrolase family 36 protein [Jiangella anatolica]|uniref:Alpha-galactosidase n=1 Tax=Jiangella anatolica TaxID=2670374 RepID=A0A2W2CCE7_9ACTN|nr:glycoside hydrolase family 36 protein [Jiangella anatolica]PZF85957.1 alpha-galactosidase [Jiangella anatolica]